MKRVVRAFLISACATAAAGFAMSYLKGVDDSASSGTKDRLPKPDADALSRMEQEQEAAMLKELESYV